MDRLDFRTLAPAPAALFDDAKRLMANTSSSTVTFGPGWGDETCYAYVLTSPANSLSYDAPRMNTCLAPPGP